jgi:putative hemolysin
LLPAVMIFTRIGYSQSVAGKPHAAAGGVVLAFWSRAGEWAKARRESTGHQEFLEWCEWLAQRISAHRAAHTYAPLLREGL